MGVGVRPRLALAEAAGLPVDRGVLVDERLETSAPGIFAAGDIARYPDPRTRRAGPHRALGGGASARARPPRATCSARRERFDAVPFFWSPHYDVTLSYVGHAERWDAVEIDGSLEARDARSSTAAAAAPSRSSRSAATAPRSPPSSRWSGSTPDAARRG